MPGTLCPGRVPLPPGMLALQPTCIPRGQPHTSVITGSTLGSEGTSLSPLLSQPVRSSRRHQEQKAGRTLGEEGPSWGQEGKVPVGLAHPVCPGLILAALSLAWQSGPAAPAVILRFLGHHRAGSAAKWGAGGGGGCRQGQGQGGDTCRQHGRAGGGGGVAAGSSGEAWRR